jgi:hypothetical protein
VSGKKNLQGRAGFLSKKNGEKCIKEGREILNPSILYL